MKVTVEDYRRCAEAGMTYAEAATHLGRDINAVRTMASLHSLSFKLCERRTDHLWRACAEAGMTAGQAAKCLGHGVAAAYRQTKINGVRFAREQRRPKPVARRNVIAELSGQQLEDYQFLTRRHQYRRDEALHAIGRADLIEAERAAP